jgi:glycosyltransferase involved in cell wall biosynthesis
LLSGVDDRFKPVKDSTTLTLAREKYDIPPRPYIFAVGTVQPRKNYVRLIQALATLREQGLDIGLVIAGGRGWLDDPIYASVKLHHVENYTHLIGFADEADLPALYSGAVCVATPSIYEGFGLPVLEAFACGTPVVTANISSLPEVAGDAALLIDPLNTDELTNALNSLISDETLRQELIEKGLKRVKDFTWDASAQHLRQIYTQMLL